MPLKNLHIVFLFVLQAGWLCSFSQKQNLKFEHLDINAGLSQNHIMCILQDSRGFMWFGTRDGLNKYDGYKVTGYKNDPKGSNSISNNYISAIMEDAKGIIWIGTRGGGLNRYDRETNKFKSFKNIAKDPNSISNDLITGLNKDSEGNLWICTENGLNFFNPGTNKFIKYNINAKTVIEDSRHNILIGTYDNGLSIFDKKTKTFTAFHNVKNDNSSISNNYVPVIFEDSKHRLWVGTNGGGLNLFDLATKKFQRFMHDDAHPTNSLPANVVFSMNEDNDGNLWIGTENGGLSIYNINTGIFDTYQHDEIDNKSLSHNSVYAIYKDVNSNMWIGTFAGGINIITKNSNRFDHYKHTSNANSLSNNNVLSMYPTANEKIWIGTDGGGVDLFDPLTKSFTHYKHIPGNKNSICGNYVLNVCEDSKGNVWIGTWGDGITVFNPRKNTYRHFKNDPNDPVSLSGNNAWVIFEDTEKNIWIGTYSNGLNLFDPLRNSFTHFDDNTGSASTKQIQSIAEDDKGNLLLGSDGGGIQVFNKFTKTFTGSFKHDDNKNSVSDNRIQNIYKDKRGDFWITTMAGLSFYDSKKQHFTTYTTADGLPNNVTFGLLEDDKSNLWISTNKGLAKFDPVTRKFKNYGVEDGLQSYEFKMRAFCKAPSGAMYFGGVNGFNEFDPAQIKADASEPPLVLTNFQIFNKNVPIASEGDKSSPLQKDISETKEITLPYSSSVFSFEFASLNYTVQEKKQYAYMLVEFDKNWNEIGMSRSATYTNLDPGHYVFKVKGLNNAGEWSTRTIAVKLTITPPFWLTWWFRLLLFISIPGGAIAYYRWRVNAINHQKIKLQYQVDEQTRQLKQSTQEEQLARKDAEHANKELERKNHELEQFAYVASHDLQEPLRTTSSFVALLQDKYQGQLDEKADKYFTYILQASDRMRVLIKDLLDYSRIGSKQEVEPVDCDCQLHEVLADLGTAISEADAVITYDAMPVISGYPTEIKQLFQNLVANAIKFRKKDTRPEVKISVKKTKANWEFVINDNGIGIDQKHQERIFIIFQRLHTRSEYAGSGIGLAHCKKIVELHGGRIWIESELGAGTAFHFTIPYAKQVTRSVKTEMAY
ncbi:MAG: two-component regulator propeller domain-containing protein [Ferruginibacter sp.]